MKASLNKRQRSLLKKIRTAITANPFSHDRLLADCAITGLTPGSKPSKTTLLRETVAFAQDCVVTLRENNQAKVSHYTNTDRKLVDGLFLFVIFHRYIDQLDQHIRVQITRQSPIPLDCAREIRQEMTEFGYSSEETGRYIAIFFQLRRAFYFIKSTLSGDCPSMAELRSRLWNNIFTHDTGLYMELLWNKMEDFSTILNGETGTGKGVAAAAIGRSGYIPFDLKKNTFKESFTRAFLASNLSQIPEQLIESELFGHTRGSFTGATRDHAGIFARSSRYGAVFLDEIGELSPHIQVKLLQILQERTFTPVGGTTTTKFSGRVIAATNRDINRLRQQGKFRNDFYYRLCSDTITIPALRVRIQENNEELKLLTTHLLKRITGSPNPTLLHKVLEKIKKDIPQNYPWHGNVRELDQCIRSILISGTCLPADAAHGKAQIDTLQTILRDNPSIARLTGWYCNHLYQQYGTYQQVARQTGLDRRTVKKYIDQQAL